MILARHAEALFWVGRYLERAETTARCINVASFSAVHLLPADAALEWKQLVAGLGMSDEEGTPDPASDELVDYLLTSAENKGSVINTVHATRDNLRVVRDRVPVELWEEVNRLHLWLQSESVSNATEAERHELYAGIRRGCQAVSGVIAEAMQRDEGHAFIVIGRSLERSILTVGLLGAALSNPRGTFDADRLLRSTSTLQAFRRHHGDMTDPMTVAIFLMCESDVPRTIRCCLNRTESRLEMLSTSAQTLDVPLRLAGRIRSRIEFGQLEDEFRSNAGDTLTDLQNSLVATAKAVSTYVAPPVGSPMMHSQFVRPGRELP